MCSLYLISIYIGMLRRLQKRYLGHKDLDRIQEIPSDYDRFEKLDDAPI